MKRIAILSATAFFALNPATSVLAQNGGDMLREFRGEIPAQTRDAARWQSDFGLVLDALLLDLGGLDVSRQAQAQNVWERVVSRAARPGAEVERLAIQSAMISKLGPETALEARLWLLKMIEWSGREEVVSALLPLLNDPDPQIQERARRALANNPSESAAASLRAALMESKAASQRMALINALGYRRDAQSVTVVGQYLQDADANVAAQAVAALGDIGTSAALQLLVSFERKAPATLRPLAVDAALESADRAVREARLTDAAPVYVSLYKPGSRAYVRTAALRGLVRVRGSNALPLLAQALNGNDDRLRAHAARMTLLIPGVNGTKSLAALLPRITPQGQLLLIEALAQRGDSGAKTAIVALGSSQSAEISSAAINAIGFLGDADDTTSLLSTAALDKPISESARNALSVLGRAKNDGPQVDANLIAALNSKQDSVRLEAVRALAMRRVGNAAPQMVRIIEAGGTVSNEAARALGEVGTPDVIPVLLSWLQKGGNNGTGEKAITAIFRRSNKEKLSDAPLLEMLNAPNLAAPLRATTYKLLGLLNTPAAFANVEAATRDQNEEVQDTAIRALVDWPGDNAIPKLLALSKEAPKPTYSILALRGVARLTSQSAKPNSEKLDIVRSALGAATRAEEKQLLLSTLGDIRTPESLRLVEPFLADEGLKAAAATTVLRVASALRGQPLRDARPIFEKALVATQDEKTVKGLQDQIKRAN